MKGRRIKTESVPELAQPHADGADVQLIQPALHVTYGSIGLEVPLYWPYHHHEWVRAQQFLVDADAELLRLPVKSSNQRIVKNESRLESALYLGGVSIVLHAILATHYFVLDIERATDLSSNSETKLSTRLKRALARIEFRNPATEDGWAKFIELHKVRDAVSHPKPTNLYGQDDGSWAGVPLAWFASGQAIQASKSYLGLFEEIAEFWQSKRKDFIRTYTLTVKRGIRSLHQAKMPPTAAGPPAIAIPQAASVDDEAGSAREG